MGGVENELETLTDSDDELAQLEREFELKKKLLLEKKRQSKSTTDTDTRHPDVLIQINATPPSSPKKEKAPQPEALPTIVHQNPRPRSAFPSSFSGNAFKSKSQSSFGAKLINASGEKPTKFNIDLQDRIFGFTDDEIPRINEPVSEIDEFTKEPIIRRYTDQKLISQLRAQYNIKMMTLQKFYAKCSPPSYTEPNYVNWMICGFVLSKPELCTTKDGKNRYVKFFFGDWNTDIGVLVFDKAVNHYMHLVAGEIIMILNPGISRKPSNGIQLKNKDNIKNVISVGLMRNYGKCKKCNRAINTAKGDLCQIHLEQQYRSGINRMELNGAISLQGPATQERRFKYSPPEELTRTYSGGNSINLSKYDDPNLLAHQARKRKREDEKANQLLESKLMRISNPTASSRLRDLGILSEKSYASVEKDSGTSYQKALTNKNLKDLGFNPLLPKKSSITQKSPTKSAKLQELLTIAKKERNHKSLFISRQDYNLQQGQKTQSVEQLRKYKQSLQNEKHVQLYDDLDSDLEINAILPQFPNKTKTIGSAMTLKSSTPQLSQHAVSHGDLIDDDDDDLDIEFANDNARKQYQTLTESKANAKNERENDSA